MPLGKVQTQIVAKLVEMGRISGRQRDVIAAVTADLNGDALDRLLQEEYRVTPLQILVAKGRALGLAPYNIVRFRVTPGTFERIPREFCEENLVIPVGTVGDLLLVVFANPFEVTVPAKIHEMTGLRVVRMLGREKDIRDKFSQGQDNRATGFDDVVQQIGAEFGTALQVGEEESVNEESGPIIQLANRVIEDAYFAGASDIHVEPQENEIIVRYRIDGLCQEKLRLPAKVGPALVARIKIMCNLDIAERRLPQDGRIVFKQFTKKSLDLDLRVSTAPLNHGEGLVMRILDKQKATLPLPALGFSEEALVRYREVIRQPYGIGLILTMVGSLALVFSGFLVINVINGLLLQQKRIIGVMKIVGGRRIQIISVYLVMVACFGLLALLIAAPASLALGYALASYIGPSTLNFDLLHFSMPPAILALEIAVALIAPMTFALFPLSVKGSSTLPLHIAARLTLTAAFPGQGMDLTAQ